MTSPIVVVAGACRIDGRGSLAPASEAEARLQEAGCRVHTLVIDPLAAGWSTPLEPDHFRSGCAPVEALAEARARLAAGRADAVVVAGDDLLRSAFAGDRERRQGLMAVYGADHPLPDLYTRLARTWCARWGLDDGAFRALARRLFDNCVATRQALGRYEPPAPAWFEPITGLFRGVDCANPSVDFEGRLVVATADAGRAAGAIAAGREVRVAGVAVAETAGDGPDHLGEIAAYDHLSRAFGDACQQAGVAFADRYRAGRALLEAYTCYPVVPLAFLLASGIARTPAELPVVLARHPVTVTGGMNLARAPWNNPALHALVAMAGRLRAGDASLGLVHGNGGLGYKQGVALLST